MRSPTAGYRAATTYRSVEHLQEHELAQRMASLEESFPSLFGAKGEPGEVGIGGEAIAFAEVASDVLGKGRKYAPLLTEAQKEWIFEGKKLVDDVARQYEAVSGKRIRLGGEHYWPRFVLDETGRVTIHTTIGAQQCPGRDRLFEEIHNSITLGNAYAKPLESVWLYGRALQKMTRDELLRQVIIEDRLGKAP